jgi:hypothetical protein
MAKLSLFSAFQTGKAVQECFVKREKRGVVIKGLDTSGLFNDGVSSSEYIAVNNTIIKE